MSVPMTADEQREWYKENIAPKIMELIVQCHTAGVEFFGHASYKDNSGVVQFTHSNQLPVMMLHELCSQYGFDIDMLVLSILQYAEDADIDTTQSAVAFTLNEHLGVKAH